MLALLKLLQSIVDTLHSEGTPRQVAAGFTLGAALGLTPLLSPHNALIVVALCVLNVSFAAGLLGWALAVPLGFALDPAFDRIGRALLLESPGLRPLWERLDATPGLALSGLDNTVVLGSLLGWLALTPAFYLAAHAFVVRYRTVLAPRVERWRIYQLLKASKVYNVYRWFAP